MRVLKTVAIKHPKDFRNILLSVSAHRDVFMIQPNGDGVIAVDIVTSEVITIEEFREEIEYKFGTARYFENYVDPKTGHDIVRGCVIHDGMQKCFYQRYDEMTQDILSDVMKQLELTKRMESL